MAVHACHSPQPRTKRQRPSVPAVQAAPHRRTATEDGAPPRKEAAEHPLPRRRRRSHRRGDGLPSRRGRCRRRADRREPAAGTSGTTFAWVGASPLGLWDYFDLNVAGMAAYRRLRADWATPPGTTRPGRSPGTASPTGRARLVARVAELRDVGYRRRSSPRHGPVARAGCAFGTVGRAGRFLPGRGLPRRGR